VTDANLVLGRLRPDAFLGGAMRLDSTAARHVMQPLAAALECSIEDAALGVLAIANEHMAQALRVISVQRGEDPRNHVLMSFGGAGGLHVCALAEALGMQRAVVPVHAGVLSALGMLAAPPSRQLSQTLTGRLADYADTVIEGHLQALASGGRSELEAEGVRPGNIDATFSLDLRYLGQSYTLNLPWGGVEATGEAFHALHEQRYGHRLDLPVELVTVRCGLRGKPLDIKLPLIQDGEICTPAAAKVTGFSNPVPVWTRASLCAGQNIIGPALITEALATTWLPEGWRCIVDSVGNLLLERKK
jgi:N-methylhydantoinase A